MAETVHHTHTTEEGRGIGVVGIIAIVILVLAALFLLIRWLPGVGQESQAPEAPGVNVTVPVPGDSGGDGGGAQGGAVPTY